MSVTFQKKAHSAVAAEAVSGSMATADLSTSAKPSLALVPATGWLINEPFMAADDALKWLHSQDPDCSRNEWLRILMVAASKGLTKQQVQAWSQQSEQGKFHQADFDAAWADGLVKLNQPHDPSGTQPAPPTASQLAVGASLEAQFKSWPDVPADNPYLTKKGIPPAGLKVVPADSTMTVAGLSVAGWLAVPCRTLEGALMTLQYIGTNGDKLSAPGGIFGNGMFVVGEIVPTRTTYVCEGIGAAHSCVAANAESAAVVSFGAGRTGKVAKALRAWYPSALRIVIVADKGQEVTAAKIAQEVGGAVVTMPDDAPSNYDANDFLLEHGSIALAELLQSAKAVSIRYQVRTAEDLMSAPPLRWMVKGLLPESGLCALYGPPGCGKSFLALDMCAAIAAGGDWFGRRTTAAHVTYVALEGQAGLGQRVRAWIAEHEAKLPERIGFVTQGFDLRKPNDVADLAQAVLAAGGEEGMIVVDTLNRAAPGSDENSAADMGRLLGACAELQHSLGGVVLLLHHTGKDAAKGLRGHSSLNGAVDVAIEVTRTSDLREWTVAKSRDGADGEHGFFRLRRVEMGLDNDGDAMTSCVVEPMNSASPTAKLPASLIPLAPIFTELSLDMNGVTFGALCKAAREKQVPGFKKSNAKRDYLKLRHLTELDDETVVYL